MPRGGLLRWVCRSGARGGVRRQRVSRCTQARTRGARVVIAGRSLAHSHRRHTHSPEFVLGVDGKVIIFLASVHIDILTYTTLGIIQFNAAGCKTMVSVQLEMSTRHEGPSE